MQNMRGKRYAIDTDSLLKDTDVFYLSYVGKIETERIKTQLKQNRLNYSMFHALKDNGFPIEKYWVKDSEINTVQVKDDLLTDLLKQTAKYRKLANMIPDFMNVRLFKPLNGYMKFCDSINVSYLTFCDDEDYKEYLGNKEIDSFRQKESEEQAKENTKSITDKPKAFIKERSKEISVVPVLQVHWNEEKYGDDLRSLVGTLSRSYLYDRISDSSLFKKYNSYLCEDVEMAFYTRFITKNTGAMFYNTPTYASYLTEPKNVCGILQAKIELEKEERDRNKV